MSALTIGSLFSGIGGLELGLERGIGNGAHTVWQVEQNEYCRAVLAKHWPAATRYEDVRHVGRANLRRVNVICGGFPCQDISVANTDGAGLDGARSGLWYEQARVIGELRPSYVVLENVANLLVRGFDRVLGSLATLGYDAEWQVLSARGVGAPHLRERVFVLAYPQRTGREGSVADYGVPRGQRAAHTLTLHASPLPWLALDGDSERLRVGDGVSVAMERLRLHALGNAVVPQVAEVVGRLIAEREAARQEAA